MKRIFSMLLSLVLAFSFVTLPMAASADEPLSIMGAMNEIFECIGDVLDGDESAAHITVITPEGEVYSAGGEQTESGIALQYTQQGNQMVVNTGGITYKTENGATVQMTYQTLISMWLDSVFGPGFTGTLNEETWQAVKRIGEGLFAAAVQSGAVTTKTAGTTTMVTLKPDLLLHAVGKELPLLLEKERAHLDGLISHLGTAFGYPELSVSACCEEIRKLGLENVNTGFEVNVVYTDWENSFLLQVSAMGWMLEVTPEKIGLNTPDGESYVLDSKDLTELAQLLLPALGNISAEAFNKEVTVEKQNGTEYFVTSLTLDTSVVEADILKGLVSSLDANAARVDALLNKYHPWIRLFTGMETPLAAADLRSMLTGLELLPDLEGAATITTRTDKTSTIIEGYLGDLRFGGNVEFGTRKCAAGGYVSFPDKREPFRLDFDFTRHYGDYTQFNISSTQPIMYTSSVSAVYQERYPSFSLTSDSGMLELFYSELPSGVNIIARLFGYLNFEFGSGPYGFRLKSQDYFQNKLLIEKQGENLLVEVGNFSFAVTGADDIVYIDACINAPDNADQQFYGAYEFDDQQRVRLVLDGENHMLMGSWGLEDIGTGNLVLLDNRLTIYHEETEIVLEDAGISSERQNVSLLKADGKLLCTIITEIFPKGGVRVRIMEGADPSRVWTVELSTEKQGLK